MQQRATFDIRPISAVNKLGKVKKNILPNLLYTQSNPSTVPIKEYSQSPQHVLNPPSRIKSAHPLNFDRDKLIEENLSLKNQLNKIKNDIQFSKKEISNLEVELNKKDKLLEDILSETQMLNISKGPLNDTTGIMGDKTKISSSLNLFSKATETHYIIGLKKQYKELKKEYQKKIEELEKNKQTLKMTKLNELVLENQILSEELTQLKGLYEFSMEQNSNNEKNLQELMQMKDAITKKDFIILNLHENIKKLQEELTSKDIEIEKLNKIKIDKHNSIVALKQKLNFQFQINEKLLPTLENIKQTKDYLQLKNDLEKKIQELKKDNAYYKDLADKRDKKVRQLEKSSGISHQSEVPYKSNIGYTSSKEDLNPNDNEGNSKVLLLQSMLHEEKCEKEKLNKMVKELKDKLKMNENGVDGTINPGYSMQGFNAGNIQNPSHVQSQSVMNFTTSNNLSESDYFTDYNLNEFIYILIKNLEASRIDMSIIESRVLNKDTMALLQYKDNQYQSKEFISQISKNLCDLLKIKNHRDQNDINSFARTFLYNHFLCNEFKDTEDYKLKFLSIFEGINFYSIEQKQSYNKALSKKLSKHKNLLIKAMEFFDDNKTGYITFTTLKKIMEQIKINLKHELLEYFIYIMKAFNDESAGMRDLKYENLIKIISVPSTLDEKSSEEEGEEEVKYPNEEDNDKEEAIEITNDEYLSKVKDIMRKIRKVLDSSKKRLNDYFVNDIIDTHQGYRGVELGRLVEILKEEFNIELSHVDIFCLFTKIRPGQNASKNFDEIDDSVEEIIDYDKLKQEVEFSERRKSNRSQEQTNIKHSLDANQDIDLKEEFSSHLNKMKISFERFLFPLHTEMKLSSNGKIFNRYVDYSILQSFFNKKKLQLKCLDILTHNKLLYNNDKINIDYLKYLLEGGDPNTAEKSTFIMFAPLKNIKKLSTQSKKAAQSERSLKGMSEEESESYLQLKNEFDGDINEHENENENEEEIFEDIRK